MKYLVAVWHTNGIYTAEVPDLSGVVTETDNFDALEDTVKEAAVGWIKANLVSGCSIPAPSPVERYQSTPNYCDCHWIQVDIPTDF